MIFPLESVVDTNDNGLGRTWTVSLYYSICNKKYTYYHFYNLSNTHLKNIYVYFKTLQIHVNTSNYLKEIFYKFLK